MPAVNHRIFRTFGIFFRLNTCTYQLLRSGGVEQGRLSYVNPTEISTQDAKSGDESRFPRRRDSLLLPTLANEHYLHRCL